MAGLFLFLLLSLSMDSTPLLIEEKKKQYTNIYINEIVRRSPPLVSGFFDAPALNLFILKCQSYFGLKLNIVLSTPCLWTTLIGLLPRSFLSFDFQLNFFHNFVARDESQNLCVWPLSDMFRLKQHWSSHITPHFTSGSILQRGHISLTPKIILVLQQIPNILMRNFKCVVHVFVLHMVIGL